MLEMGAVVVTSIERRTILARRRNICMGQSGCRSCGATLEHTFVDLGMSPLANSYIKPDHPNRMEPFYSMHVYVCEKRLLVQLQQFSTPYDIFSEYAYFHIFGLLAGTRKNLCR